MAHGAGLAAVWGSWARYVYKARPERFAKFARNIFDIQETDDEKAAVGSINLDFRSLYLHFECGTYLYRNSTVADVEKDFENTLEKCIPVTLKDCAQYNWFGTKAGRFLRLIAPLM